MLERRSGGLERGLEPLLDGVVHLAAETGLAAPARGRPDADRGRQLAGVEQRHVAGDEHEVVDRHGGIVAGGGNRLAGQGDPLDLPARTRHGGEERGVGVGARGEAAFHDDGGAGRNVAAELGEAREVIGRYGGTLGVELIDPDGVAEIRAELLEDDAHALEDVVGLAAERRPPAQRISGRPFDLGREALFES